MASRTILQAGRRKAYRPIRLEDRRAALAAALDAWDRGDWFEAHELLEPAWMGTDDLAERLRYQALIKVAAAFVHRARGNRAGMVTNLRGARERVAESAIDAGLMSAIDELAADAADETRALVGLRPPDLRELLARDDADAT